MPLRNKHFTEKDCEILEDIIVHRRDVRGNQFTDKKVSDEILDRLLFVAMNAPSVGFSQPWEFVIIRDPSIKTAIRACFEQENRHAGQLFSDEKQDLYLRLKLEGITEAPVNIAVFYKPSSSPVLGQTSMNKVGLYSVVCAVQNMWLFARALNIGIGWVSILDEQRVKQILKAPAENELVAYLCLGYTKTFLERPELELLKWEKRKTQESLVYYEHY